MTQSPNLPSDGPRRAISQQRKSLYYLGMAISMFGLLLFLSTFVTAVWNFGDFSNFQGEARSAGFRAFGGIFLLIVGGFLANLGARGMAGSGLKLDPEQARKDVEPWSRMSGGMLGDMLDEAGIKLPGTSQQADLPLDEKLRRLHALRQDGILDEAEYQREKQELLDKN